MFSKKIVYKNTEIVHTSLKELKDIDEGIKVIHSSIDVVSAHSEKSVLTLVDFTGFRFNNRLLSELKVVEKKNAKYIKASAVVGLTTIPKMVAKASIKISKRHVEFFDDIDDAKEWLIKVAQEG